MNSEDPRIAAVFASLTPADQDEGHPDIDALSAYQRREVTEERRLEIQRHLVACKTCTELLLDLAAFPEVSLRAEELALSPEEEAEGWEMLERRLLEEASEAGLGTFSAPVSPGPFRPVFSARNIAAVLTVTSLALAFLSLSLFNRLQETRQPAPPVLGQAEIQILTPVQRETRQLETPSQLIATPVGDFTMLYLVTLRQEQAESFEVVLSPTEGEGEWSLEALQRDTQGGFSLLIHPARLPGGTYRVALFGRSGDEKTLFDTYEFELPASDAEAGPP